MTTFFYYNFFRRISFIRRLTVLLMIINIANGSLNLFVVPQKGKQFCFQESIRKFKK